MLAQERHKIILEMLGKQPIIKTQDIAEKFEISNLTARRDLDVLREQGFVRRIYGGAILIPASVPNSTEDGKGKSQNPMKKRMEEIGRIAASLVEPGDTIFMGSGSLTLETAKKLLKMTNLTFITSSMTIANTLMTSDNKIYLLGGLIDPFEQNIYSRSAMDMMEKFLPNKAILSCGGITARHGVTMDYQPVAELSAIAVRNASRTILVTRSQTFGRDVLNRVCDLTNVSDIVTDDNLSGGYRKEMEKIGISMHYAETHSHDGES